MTMKKSEKKSKKKPVKKMTKKKKILTKKITPKKVTTIPKKETTLIKSITKKKKSEERKYEKILTGIKNLDKLTEGGFVKSSINMIVGGTGTGKSIFAIQFLIEGLKKGEPCLYVSFEEKKEEVYSNMLRLGWNMKEYENKGKFFFLEYTPEKVKTMLDEGGGEIETLVLTKNIARIGIDSITSFTSLFTKEAEKREATLSLLELLRKWNSTVLLTYEKDPSIEKKTSSMLEFEVDSIITLYSLRIKNKREKFLEVFKMRGTRHSIEIFPFSIEKGGIDLKCESCKNLPGIK
jgi:circadian clock protein KaiC